MLIKKIILLSCILAMQFPWDGPAQAEMTQYYDEDAGFYFSMPDYWVLEDDIDEMLSIQDGSIDLIHEELLSNAEKEAYRVMVHVDGSPRYVSNVVFHADPHHSSGMAVFSDHESAVLAVNDDFEDNRASGTYFLQEIYLGDSHTYVYRRSVQIPDWDDEIRITYYITASTTYAYMLVETVMMSSLDEVTRDNFNQIIQSFRVPANEPGGIDPSLDWGAVKPGEETEGVEEGTDVGEMEIREDFDDNLSGWPVGDDARIRGGEYVLNSQDGYPFTVRNTSLDQIAFDFSYEGEMTFLDGDRGAGYGLVFGYLDADNYYAFLVTRNGQYLVIREEDGQVEQLIPWSSLPVPPDDNYTLLVQGDYKTMPGPGMVHQYDLYFFVDDEPVATVMVDDVLDLSGWYGIFVSKDLNVAFDWLESRNYLLNAVMTTIRFE
jgi:hypothetical protein